MVHLLFDGRAVSITSMAIVFCSVNLSILNILLFFFFYKILLTRQVFPDSILTTIRKLAKICLLQVTNLFSNQNIDVRKEMTFETKCEG